MKYNKIIIYITAFITGFTLMGYEIFGSRVLNPYFGSATYVWGALLSIFMTGLTIGYAIGGKIAERYSGYFPLSLLLISPGIILTLFPIYGKTFCTFAFNLNINDRVDTIIASTLLFLMPTLFIGAISPYLVTMNIPNLKKVGSGSGTVFSIATLGSIAGTIISAFFLVGSIQTSTAITLFGTLLIINATICLVFYKVSSSHKAV